MDELDYMDVCFATLAIQKYRCLAVVLGGLAAKYAGQPTKVSLLFLVGEAKSCSC